MRHFGEVRTIDFVFLTIILGMLLCFVIIYNKQQQTIDALTNRLMVLSGHREYAAPVTVTPEKPTRKPMSWHDDPNIEEEDISQ